MNELKFVGDTTALCLAEHFCHCTVGGKIGK